MTHYKTELTYFRAFICILIVLVHILTQYMGHVEDSETSELKLLYYIQNIIIFATPSFIILSQLLTTLNYKTVDRHYLWKRVKYILCPYLLVGTFYAYSEHKITGNTFTEEWWKSVILGHWHGYFILIIMQFFVLSYLLYKVSPRIFDSKTVLVLSFIVQFSFLHLYNENAVFAKYFTAFIHLVKIHASLAGFSSFHGRIYRPPLSSNHSISKFTYLYRIRRGDTQLFRIHRFRPSYLLVCHKFQRRFDVL